jgi:hypothetical protein
MIPNEYNSTGFWNRSWSIESLGGELRSWRQVQLTCTPNQFTLVASAPFSRGRTAAGIPFRNGLVLGWAIVSLPFPCFGYIYRTASIGVLFAC